MPGIIGSTGWDRSRAWIWLFSSTHSTTAFSGGLWQRPTTSTTFSANCGSVDSLNPSARCGLRPKSRQICPIAERDSPDLFAIDLRDQCAASSRVATTTAPAWSGVTGRGPPGTVLVRQPVQAGPDEPRAPLACRDLMHPQPGRDFPAVLAVRAGQHDPAPLRQRLRAGGPPRPPLQRGPFVLGERVHSAFGRPVLVMSAS